MSSETVNAGPEGEAPSVFTTRNASTFSAYHIRQELNRRGAFDFKEDDEVNFRTLLQRLMVELVKDEETEANRRGEQKQTETLSAVEEAKKLREQRKQEALERSRARQSNPEYFKQKAGLNVPPPKAEGGAEDDKEETENDSTEKFEETDPFRSYKPSGRPKVFVK